MELTLEKKHENKIEFFVEGVSSGFANMVRRYAISKVPVFAIDVITFYDNSSAFWDEYLAHRIGLMPVVTPSKTPKSAEIIFSLDATGPKKVYSGDMKSSDKEVKMAKDSIILVTLSDNQHLRFEGKAILSSSKTHAKFQPGIVSYGESGENKFKFLVETFYQMPPAEIIERTCEIIESDMQSVLDVLVKKPEKSSASKKKKSKKKAEE